MIQRAVEVPDRATVAALMRCGRSLVACLYTWEDKRGPV